MTHYIILYVIAIQYILLSLLQCSTRLLAMFAIQSIFGFISPISQFLRRPCHTFTEHMVPRCVDITKINHGQYFFIAPFSINSFLMIATLSKDLHILTRCIYLNSGHNSVMCALITNFPLQIVSVMCDEHVMPVSM